MLELINVKKTYYTKSGETNALNGLSVTLPDTGLVFVTGKSGCGKTTLLNCVGGLDGIDSGEIIIDGKNFSTFTTEDYDSYRNTFIGFIFQEYNLLPEYTIEKNVMIANELQGVQSNMQEINDILELVDLAGLNLRKPSELSGGQKQRVAIARALIKNPKIIMADEPTGALDSNTGIQVMQTLKKLSKDKLVIIVSHDLELAEKFADRILRLVDGVLVEDVTLTDTEITSNVLLQDDKLTVRAGSELNTTETATLVKAIREKKAILITEQINQRAKKPTEPITAVHPEKPVSFLNSKMKVKSAMGLGLKSLMVKPVRLIATILLSVIAFALFGIFDTIGAYNDARAISNLLRSEEYNTIVINASHIENNTGTNVRVTSQAISKLSKDTGHNFRGLYEIYDKASTGITNSVAIKEVNTTTKTGSEYWYYHVDDFIEFSPNEITSVTKNGVTTQIIDANGFNYRIIAGRFPTKPSEMQYITGGPMLPMKEYNFTEIAISKYLAESLLYWLAQSNPENKEEALLNGNLMTCIEDFVGQTITVDNGYVVDGGNIPYVITGIIDTGDIPSKYESLKTSFPTNHTAALAADLSTFINTGTYLKFFVPTGYVQEWREFTGRKNTYFAGDNSYTLYYDNKSYKKIDFTTRSGSTAFYNYSADFKLTGKDDGNIFFFQDSDLDRNLGTSEILLSTDVFQIVYANEIASMPDNDSIRALTILDNPLYSANDKRAKVDALVNNLGSNLYKTITLEKRNTTTNEKTNFTYTVVGLYGGVNNDITKNGIYSYGPLMLSKTGLERLGIQSTQGEYARMVSTINSSYFASSNLSNSMASSTGFKFNWYKNSVLNSIKDNQLTLQQFSNLFLYVSILLAFFSVFMLFNYISTSIVSKRQSIGVLRALGSNGRDIFRIFFTESMLISITNGVFASLVAFIGCIFVNSYIKNIMNMTLNFAIFGIRQIVLLMIISIITGTLSSLLPIVKICKEKPVELIRKF